jgi:peptidoglycan/xylan/chitin deacetylase (PgdA/CDA1 family)
MPGAEDAQGYGKMDLKAQIQVIAQGPLVYAPRGTILSLHRIVPRDELAALESNRTLELTPEDFDALISWACSKGYTPVSLGEFCASVRARRGQQMLCLTFDDGYADNLTHALPVLEKHAAPATIFVTTDMLDYRFKIWWYAFDDILRGEADREQRFSVLCRSVRENCADENGRLFRRLGLTDDFFRDLCARMSLTWTDLRKLARHPLITIGAHTVSHPWLSDLPDDELASELRTSKSRLEQEIQSEVTLFAYPFGTPDSCGPREFEAAKRAGFEAAVTTQMDNVVDGHRNHLWALPRHWAGEPNFALPALESRIRGNGGSGWSRVLNSEALRAWTQAIRGRRSRL